MIRGSRVIRIGANPGHFEVSVVFPPTGLAFGIMENAFHDCPIGS